jgi:hypothetical protein
MTLGWGSYSSDAPFHGIDSDSYEYSVRLHHTIDVVVRFLVFVASLRQDCPEIWDSNALAFIGPASQLKAPMNALFSWCARCCLARYSSKLGRKSRANFRFQPRASGVSNLAPSQGNALSRLRLCFAPTLCRISC